MQVGYRIYNNNNYIHAQSFKANPMPAEQARHMDKKLKEAGSVDIFCHAATDEDAFNSAKVMYEYLEELGKKPRIITSNNSALYGFDRQKYNIVLMKELNDYTQTADLALCVDFSKRERLDKKASLYLNRFSDDKIVGLDHHSEGDCIIADTKKIAMSYDSVKQMPDFDPVNYYVDSSSKSCSAVIYRFFEALNKKLSLEQLSSLFCGMLDDSRKFDVISWKKKEDNTYDCTLNTTTNVDKNTQEVFNKVNSGLKTAKKTEILEHLDILENLTVDEKLFVKKLFDGVKFSPNGKFAYFVIAPDDEDWINLGGDTNRTSTIIRDFRMRLLKNSPEDIMISNNLSEKLKNVEVAGVFYPDYDEEVFKKSFHSKKNYVARYQNYVRENIYPELTAGGHSNRGGGRILTLDKEACEQWVGYFVEAAENVVYD